MKKFSVKIEPDIIISSRSHVDFNTDEINFEKLYRELRQEYEICYIVCNKIFKYYPSTIVTTFNDLMLELEYFKEKKSHLMTLAGYGVLGAEINGNKVSFYCPQDYEAGLLEFPICYDVDISQIEDELERLSVNVWCMIEKYKISS